jgi:uncharacterized membrane protein
VFQRLLGLWDDLRSGLWFVPGLLASLAVVMAWTVLRLDRWAADSDVGELAWAFSGGADSARQILATIAGSMVTVAGVTFSVTVVALTLAAGQYSPRILGNFMRDRFNQLVLGAFIGTFVYSLLVLRSIRGGDEAYVPAVGVTVAIILAIASLGLLILFIHHIAVSIQVSSMIQSVHGETSAELDAVFGRSATAVGPAWIRTEILPVPQGFRIHAGADGYVQRVDTEAIVEAAEAGDVTVEMLVGPGDFSARGTPLAVADREPVDPDALVGGVRGACLVGRQRTIPQDPAFGFRQLVDIAVKALSPGINDPTTAANCVDALTSLLASLADRDWPSTDFEGEDGVIRLHMPHATFGDYLALAFTEIRRYARTDLAVTLAVLEGLGRVATTTRRPDRREALWREARAVMAGATDGIRHPDDLARLEAQFRRVAAELERTPPST